MPFSPQTIEEKPYNRCINCIHIGTNCDGPNFLAMETERWCEWVKLRKDFLGWTNAKVAELAGVSKISVDRIMAGSVKDLRNTTMQAVTRALVNGTWGQYPCAMVALATQENEPAHDPELLKKAETADKAIEQCQRLQAAMDRMNEEHRADLAAARAEAHETIDLLKSGVAQRDRLLNERYDFLKAKDRVIATLSGLLGVAVVAIIAALVVDRTNSDIGFFWVDGKTNHFGATAIGILLVVLGVAAVVLPVTSILKSRKKHLRPTEK